jgi:hypothetical protein
MSVNRNATPVRPTGVTVVGVLIFIAAIYNFILGVWSIFAPLGDNPKIPGIQTDTGQPVAYPGWWLIINGLLAIVLGLIYLWLGRMTFAGSRTAQVLIQVLAVINIVFALFRLPYGWIAIIINALILLFVSGGKAKEWFNQMP